jgi:predicted phage baseplate assembly protein
MSLLEPVLDDLKFQKDIVDEVRRRIVRYCPEWTDYNLSDPGITIAEMHAWMTEKLVYRLNQVPRKTYIHFLNLLGEDLLPAQPAKTELTFYFAAPYPIDPDNPQAQDGQTQITADMEVATLPTERTPEVVFSIDETRVLAFPILKYLYRHDDPIKNYWQHDSKYPAKCKVNAPMKVFADPPREGDVFYIGFDAGTGHDADRIKDRLKDMRGYVLQLWFGCEEAAGSGVERDNPPWEWSCWVKQDGEEKWQPVLLGSTPNERDTTGGLNNAEGKLVLYLPTTLHPSAQAATKGDFAFWLRCQYKRNPNSPDQGHYLQQPTIKSLRAEVIGLTVSATHARVVHDELLGISDGEAGQTLVLQRSPVLAPANHALMVIDEIERDAHGDVTYQQTWHQVDHFANSDAHDRHFVLDVRTGQIGFGPLVQQRNGQKALYGRVPAPGRELRVRKYRYGGGTEGNVPARSLNMLRQSIPFVDRVLNLQPAEGGMDAEPVEESLMRLRREMWSRRAVTAQDYEVLARQTRTTRPVQRARFVVPTNATALGVADVRIVPALKPDDQGQIALAQLALGTEMRQAVQQHLDERRLLTTILRVSEPTYVGIKVLCRVRAEKNRGGAVLHEVKRALRMMLAPVSLLPEEVDAIAEPNTRQDDIPMRLRDFLSGLAASDDRAASKRWEGWPFGRDLSLADLHVCLLGLPGVRAVQSLSLLGCRFDAHQTPEPNDLIVLGDRVELAAHELICSLIGPGLSHEVEVVEA